MSSDATRLWVQGGSYVDTGKHVARCCGRLRRRVQIRMARSTSIRTAAGARTTLQILEADAIYSVAFQNSKMVRATAR